MALATWGLVPALVGLLTFPGGLVARDESAGAPVTAFPFAREAPERWDVQAMQYGARGTRLVVRGAKRQDPDATLAVYDTARGEPVVERTIRGGGGFRFRSPGFAVTPDQSWVVYGSEAELRYLPLSPGVPARAPVPVPRQSGKAGLEATRVWLPDDRTLVLDRGQGAVCELERWDLQKRTRVTSSFATNPNGDCSDVVVNAQTGRVAAAFALEKGHAVESWTLSNRSTRVVVKTLDSATVSSLALSRDGLLLAAGYGGGRVGWFDPTTGQPIRHTAPLGQYSVAAMAFHPTGSHLACGTLDRKGQPNLFVIRLSDAKIVSRVVTDERGVTAVCFDESGTRLATYGATGVIKTWDAAKLLEPEMN